MTRRARLSFFTGTDSRPSTARCPSFGFSSKDSVRPTVGDYAAKVTWVFVVFDEIPQGGKTMENHTKTLHKFVEKYVFCPVENPPAGRLFPKFSPQLLHNLLISLWTSRPQCGKIREDSSIFGVLVG
jgi:hypothetical protein